MDTKESKKEYYLNNKEKLNHARLGLYHKKKYGIPMDKLDTYLKGRVIYNSIMKNKDNLDLDFISFLLQKN